MVHDGAGRTLTIIAQVGGFLGRKGDGEPGVKTFWRGSNQLHAAAEPLRALQDGLGRLLYSAMTLRPYTMSLGKMFQFDRNLPSSS